MKEIMNSSNKNNLKSVFGLIYCISNNPDKINENYNSIISTRANLLSKLYYFIETSPDTSSISLSEIDLDLIKFNTISVNPEQYKSLPYFMKYFNYEHLKLFAILRKIIIDKSSLTEEDITILNSIIRNKSRVDSLLTNSINGKLSIDKKTLELILFIASKYYLTTGHTIKVYENLCRELNLGTYTNNQILEYKNVS
mgnify:FL=1